MGHQRFSNLGSELTGYPAVSIFHEFKYHPKEVIGGTQDWIYEHRARCSGRWRSGRRTRPPTSPATDWIDWFREHPVDDELKLLKWSDEQWRRQAHVDWNAVPCTRSSARWRSAAGTR